MNTARNEFGIVAAPSDFWAQVEQLAAAQPKQPPQADIALPDGGARSRLFPGRRLIAAGVVVSLAAGAWLMHNSPEQAAVDGSNAAAAPQAPVEANGQNALLPELSAAEAETNAQAALAAMPADKVPDFVPALIPCAVAAQTQVSSIAPVLWNSEVGALAGAGTPRLEVNTLNAGLGGTLAWEACVDDGAAISVQRPAPAAAQTITIDLASSRASLDADITPSALQIIPSAVRAGLQATGPFVDLPAQAQRDTEAAFTQQIVDAEHDLAKAHLGALVGKILGSEADTAKIQAGACTALKQGVIEQAAEQGIAKNFIQVQCAGNLPLDPAKFVPATVDTQAFVLQTPSAKNVTREITTEGATS